MDEAVLLFFIEDGVAERVFQEVLIMASCGGMSA